MGTLDNHNFDIDTPFYVEDGKAVVFYRTEKSVSFLYATFLNDKT